uniref:FACT complex subunit SSRP1 n=1 Tax=Meloidogyne javanica TaxID=6303 RepID=A0A915MK91_MELJA
MGGLLESSLKRNDLSLKGWNYGETEFEGQNLIFNIGEKIAFEVPLSNVMRCVGTKSEAIVEFIANEESPVQLTEMLMRFAEVESEKDQAIVTLPDILLATPRGRYEIKVFPNHLSFHGKSYDYKIPLKTIMRMFLLSHKDGRHMYFVLHINPPIRQGQTRYPFLVLEFSKEDHIELDLCLTEEQLAQQYQNKLDMHMRGYLYEIIAKLFRVLVNSRIIVPGNFTGASGTPAISCAVRQSMGFLYPLEKGFVYVHKPALYIREEYNKLFDYVQSKGLKIRNAQRLGEKSYKEDKFAASSDEELDPYKEKLKDDARERAANSDSDSEDDWLDLGVELLVLGKSSDSETEQSNRIEKSSVLQSGGPTSLRGKDYDMEKDLKKREKEKESSEGSGSEPDEEYDSSAAASVSDDLMDGGGETEKTSKKSEKKKKEKKDKKEKVTKKGGGEKNDKKEKKKKKDPNAPKRNQTAFFLWQTENRSKIKKEGDTIAETATRAGQMWKEMSAEDKQPYEQKAKEDKERYEREMKIYKDKKQKSDEESNNDEDDEPSTSAKATSKASSSKPSTTTKPSTKSSAKNSSPIKKPISKEFVDDSTDSSSISD